MAGQPVLRRDGRVLAEPMLLLLLLLLLMVARTVLLRREWDVCSRKGETCQGKPLMSSCAESGNVMLLSYYVVVADGGIMCECLNDEVVMARWWFLSVFRLCVGKLSSSLCDDDDDAARRCTVYCAHSLSLSLLHRLCVCVREGISVAVLTFSKPRQDLLLVSFAFVVDQRPFWLILCRSFFFPVAVFVLVLSSSPRNGIGMQQLFAVTTQCQ